MPDEMPCLNAMSLDELKSFALALTRLAQCGETLDVYGFAPEFDLTPGYPVSIALDFVMSIEARVPEAGEPPAVWSPAASAPITAPALLPEMFPTEKPEPLAAGAAREGLAAAHPDAGAAAPIFPDPRGDIARGDGEQAPVAAGPREGEAPAPLAAEPEAVTPGSARALAATAQPPRWTEEEDATAIRMAVERLRVDHWTDTELARVIAAALGRPQEGTKFRLKTKLWGAIQAGLKAPKPAAPEPEPVAPPLVVVEAAPVPEAVFAKPQPEPAAPEPQPRPLGNSAAARHLTSLPPSVDWTREDDIELLEALGRGFKLAEIAVDMRRDWAALKRRSDALLQFDPQKKRTAFLPGDLLKILKA